MKISMQDKTPQGYIIQIEDWSETYPKLHKKNDVVAVYPIAKASSEYRWIVAGDTFRCMFHFENESEAKKAYLMLTEGTRKPEDYANYADIKHRRYLLGDNA